MVRYVPPAILMDTSLLSAEHEASNSWVPVHIHHTASYKETCDIMIIMNN